MTTGGIRTLDDIEEEWNLIIKRRRHLEEQREKLEQEIGDLNVKLNSLEIQRARLKQLKTTDQ